MATIKDYLLSKPDTYKFEILYLFESYDKENHKYITEIDEEYSSGIYTVGEFRKDVAENCPGSHYHEYDWIYEDEIAYYNNIKFYKGDEIKNANFEVYSIHDEGQEIICITVLSVQ